MDNTFGIINPNFALIHGKAKHPTKGYLDDAGIDFYSVEEKSILPCSSASIHTGITWCPSFVVPGFYSQEMLNFVFSLFNIYMKIESRSGLSFKFDIETGAGIIDQSYLGEFIIKVYNNGEDVFIVKEGDKICQGVIDILPKIMLPSSSIIDTSVRGEKGFGSTG
jgi:dUTP pyrophosphatase